MQCAKEMDIAEENNREKQTDVYMGLWESEVRQRQAREAVTKGVRSAEEKQYWNLSVVFLKPEKTDRTWKSSTKAYSNEITAL